MSKTGSGIRRIFNRDGCEIWSLSPFDIMNRKREVIERFITDDLPKAVAEQQWTDGADEVYVNGDSFIREAKALEPTFKRRMFAETRAS